MSVPGPVVLVRTAHPTFGAQAIKNPALGWVLEFGSATWTRQRS